MEKSKSIEFLKSIIGSTVYVINKNKVYADDEFLLILPQELSKELFNSLRKGIKEDRYEFCSWKQYIFPEEIVYALYFKLDYND